MGMSREEAYRYAMRACEETWNEKTCKQIKEALEQTTWIPCPDNDGERELLDRAVKALEAELATKTCNKQIASKLEDAELARDSRETCNNKQVSCKLVASDDTISRQAAKELYFKDGYIGFHKICELPSAQHEPSGITDEQAIRHLQSTGWMQNHDREMYESGLREKLADDSGSYDSLTLFDDAISRADAEALFRNARGELHKSAIRNEQNGHPIKDLPTRDLMLLNAEQMIHLLPSVTPKQDPCEDAISRQTVLDIINFEDKWLLDAKGHNANTRIAFGGMRSKVSALPPATPEQRAGHWILRDDINGQYQCDKCGMFSGLSKFDVEEEGRKLSNFCSNCGAKMVEPQESEDKK